MKVSLGQHSAFFAKAAQAVQNKAGEQPASAVQSGAKERKDTWALSGKNRAGAIIEQLQQQKEQIKQNRSKLIAATLEEGGTMESIEAQLDVFDQRLQTLDEQIAQVKQLETQKIAQQEEEEKTPAEKQPKTKEEAEQKQMAAVSKLTAGIDQVKELYQIKRRTGQELKIANLEIELDMRNTGLVLESSLQEREKLMQSVAKADSQTAQALGEVQKENEEQQEQTSADKAEETKQEE